MRARFGGCCRYDSAVIEAESNPTAVQPFEFQYARFALLADELKHVGDAEVFEISSQCDGHRQEFLRAATDVNVTTAHPNAAIIAMHNDPKVAAPPATSGSGTTPWRQ